MSIEVDGAGSEDGSVGGKEILLADPVTELVKVTALGDDVGLEDMLCG